MAGMALGSAFGTCLRRPIAPHAVSCDRESAATPGGHTCGAIGHRFQAPNGRRYSLADHVASFRSACQTELRIGGIRNHMANLIIRPPCQRKATVTAGVQRIFFAMRSLWHHDRATAALAGFTPVSVHWRRKSKSLTSMSDDGAAKQRGRHAR
jgi:hypothetical protein